MVDVLVVGTVGGWAVYFLHAVWSPAAAVVVVLAVASALVWRRPLACLALALAAVAAALVAGVGATEGPAEWGVAMALVAGVSLGVFERPRVAAVGVLLLGLAVGLAVPRDPGPPLVVALELAWPVFPVGGAAVIAGALARARRKGCAERARLAVLAAASPEDVARLAVARERERLLADVHAVLLAAMSAMLEHAHAAEVCAAHPEAARTHLRAVQREGRAAITELRVVLGQLRAGTPDLCEGMPELCAATPDLCPRIGDQGRPEAARRLRAEDALTAGLVVLAAVEPWGWGDAYQPALPGPTLLASAGSAVAAATVVLRRDHPAVGAAGLGVILAISGLVGAPVMLGMAVSVVMLMLTWSTMARLNARRVAAVAVLLAGAVCYMTVTAAAADLGLVLVATLATATGSAATAHHRGIADSATARAVTLTSQRQIAAAEAVRTQRLSVARELHDVVSHAVVVMTVQAGAAETLLALDPAAAQAAVDRARIAGAATLADLDHLFAALRGDAAGPVGPVSHDIPGLVQRMRAGGLAVDLHSAPAPNTDPLVFRVVQETLTNTLRHASGATVHLSIMTSEQGTTVEAVDDGPGPAPGAARGYGLVGITERVEHAGGRVDTGPGPDGRGFRLLARIPTRTQAPS